MKCYTTRPSTPDDLLAVEVLLQASYPQLMAPAYEQAILAPTLKLITKASPSLLASGTYYVAEAEDGTAVGCGGWTLERPPGTEDSAVNTAHLRHFATHPEWIRGGVGRAIYRLCEAGAIAAGANALEVCSSLNGESFYSAMGFEPVRRIEVSIGPSILFPSILMRRAV